MPLNSEDHCDDLLQGLKLCRVASVPFHLVSLNDQFRELVAAGVDLTIVSSGGEGVQDLAFPSSHTTVPIRRELSPVADLRCLIELVKLFRSNSFDVVHSDTPKAGLLCALAGFIARTPIRLHTWTGQRWATLGPSFLRTLLRSMDRLIGILNTKCYADSFSQREYLCDEGIIKPQRIAVIGGNSNAGVQTDRFSSDRFDSDELVATRNSLTIPDGATTITFVGRLTVDKGIRELVGAVSTLRSMGHDTYLILVGPLDSEIAGGGSSHDGLVDILDVDWIRRTGHSACPEKYLAISTIFAIPSYREGFGTVAIEAASMGLPVVATDIVGLRDAVVDSETGILVPPPRCRRPRQRARPPPQKRTTSKIVGHCRAQKSGSRFLRRDNHRSSTERVRTAVTGLAHLVACRTN